MSPTAVDKWQKICAAGERGKVHLQNLNLKEPCFSAIEFFGCLFMTLGLLVWAVAPPRFDVSLLRHEPALLAERLLVRPGVGELANTPGWAWVGVFAFSCDGQRVCCPLASCCPGLVG